MDLKEPREGAIPWACGHGGEVWYANLHADVDDPLVIEHAKRLVDKAVPQKLSTFFGGHYCSFVTREYLLNLLLFHHKEHGRFPVGPVCVVSRKELDSIHHPKWHRWLNWLDWMWRIRKQDFDDPHWLYIPSVQSVTDVEKGPAV